MATPNPPADTPRRPWPWLCLAPAVAWTVAIRVPLVLNAGAHLDSDLAVDGLTLLDAMRGHWRWHYPGTPHIGSPAVLLSVVPALLDGTNPISLAAGGTVAAVGTVVATFLLAWRVFGLGVALGSLLPLTFASNGAVWLSGRITGGHLLDVVWHAGAFLVLAGWIKYGGRRRAFGLGLWCGFGLYLDSMFAVTLVGLIPAAVVGRPIAELRTDGLPAFGLLLLGLLIGIAPKELGRRVDPHNPYGDQFTLATRPEVLREHATLLIQECLPRLAAGHVLPSLRTDPDPLNLGQPSTLRSRPNAGVLAATTTGLGLTLWAAAALALILTTFRDPDRCGRVVAFGLAVSTLATLAGFVLNRNIFNSDNYRYLVPLLVQASIGAGLALSAVWRSGAGGRVLAGLFGLAFAGGMTADLADWYSRFGWVNAQGLPVRKPVDDPALAWLASNRDVGWIEGGYWDVYQLSFQTSGRVRGRPYPVFPDRFPDWGPAAGRRRAVIARNDESGRVFAAKALKSGGKVALQSRGLTIVVLP